MESTASGAIPATLDGSTGPLGRRYVSLTASPSTKALTKPFSLLQQIILANPISFIGYSFASWRFFDDRVRYEERMLVQFFGSKYLNYKQAVPTGLPYINGF